MRRISFMLISALLLVGHIAFAESNSVDYDFRFESGVAKVDLLELFTSEGCSSCPPADRWFSELKKDERLWKEFVPVAFHVDYWDYIGWKDRFASPEFSDRQRQYAVEGGARVVYTPGMFRNGVDWTAWRKRGYSSDARSEPGNLVVSIQDDVIAASFEAAQINDDSMTLNVALLGMNRITRVKAGENTGRILRHDFVALELHTEELDLSPNGYAGQLTMNSLDTTDPKTAIVAWISRSGTQAPVQAVGGYIRPPQ